MKRIAFVAYAAGVAAAAIIAAPIAVRTINFQARPEVNSVLLWLLWSMATFGPIILSIIVCMVDQEFTSRWIPHFAFIPIAIFAWQQGTSLFLRVSGLWIHDGPAGDASALGTLYLILALLVHISAFAIAVIASVKSGQRAD